MIQLFAKSDKFDSQYLLMLFIQEYLKAQVPNLYKYVAALGAVFVFFQVFIILRGVFRLFFRRKQNLIKMYGQKSWVLVTGSSDGIGKEFALQFAREGFNIILLARTQSKLKAVKAQIKDKYPSVEVEIVIADLISEGKKDDIKAFLPQLNRFKDISIIVNNAGVDILNKFTDLSSSKIVDLVAINCFALSAICHKFIPYFQNRMKQTKKKCGFINVGSVAGQMPIPLFNVYSASKGYVGQLTNNLAMEYPNINWFLLKPSEVCTAMTCYKTDIFTVTTQQCVAGTIKDFGHEVQTNGSLSHKIQSYLYQVIPSWLFNLIWYNIIGPLHIKDRERYHKTH